MSYVSTNLRCVVEGSLSGGSGAVFYHASTDSSTQVVATGFFTGAGRGRSTASKGMVVGDLLHHVRLSTAGVPLGCETYVVSASTIDQASTSASTAFNFARNVTVVGVTT